jgi:mannose-6-phosphate isomerase-like protein (cupin superfamily)
MPRAMLSVLVVFLFSSSIAGQTPIPATHVPAADIQATLERAIAERRTDTPIRTVDAGGHNVGIGLVHRRTGTNIPGGAVHTMVTEVYHVLEGSGTLVTGGTLRNPRKRDDDASVVVQINGPGISGDAIEGGVRRRIRQGDVVIIPAGTPHWWPEVEEPITYTVVRVDPEQVVTLK